MTAIVIADDHPLFRNALSTAVRRVRPDATLHEASTLGQARGLLSADVALLLLDLHMDDSDGLAGLIAIRHDFPAIPVMVVSASEGQGVIGRAIAFGAAGYVPKSSPLEVICQAVDAVMAGDIWTPPVPEDVTSGRDGELGRIASLTPAQLRVLIGLREGRLNKQIAFDMGITEATVKAHVTAVFRKLGVSNRTQAVLAADALAVEQTALSDHA